jgi:hypothetical protein
MASVATVVFVKMLDAFGFNCETISNKSNLSAQNELLAGILDLFTFNGDKIATQYAGSEAFHKAQVVKNQNGEWKQCKRNITSAALNRYLSNALKDAQRQKVWWLYLGDFIPSKTEKDGLWDLDIEGSKI